MGAPSSKWKPVHLLFLFFFSEAFIVFYICFMLLSGTICAGDDMRLHSFLACCSFFFRSATSRSLNAARPRWFWSVDAEKFEPAELRCASTSVRQRGRLRDLSVSPVDLPYQSSRTALKWRTLLPAPHCLQGLSTALVFHCLALCSIDLTSPVSKGRRRPRNGKQKPFPTWWWWKGVLFWWVVIYLAWIHHTGVQPCSGLYVTVLAQDVTPRSSHLPAHSKIQPLPLNDIYKQFQAHFSMVGSKKEIQHINKWKERLLIIVVNNVLIYFLLKIKQKNANAEDTRV